MLKTLLFALSLLGTAAVAQTIDVNNLKADGDSSTTIRIEKGKPGDTTATTTAAKQWEVSDGSADVEGETSATAKEAKAAWKKACDQWKKEFREDNKENKILSMNCGTASCDGDAGSKVCTSKATFKIKTRVD